MKYLLTVLVLFLLNPSWAQYEPPIEIPEEIPDLITTPFFPSEEKPTFIGTDKDMMQFIELHFQFTPEMLVGQSQYELKCNLQVDVSATGQIINVHDWNNLHVELDVFDPTDQHIRSQKTLLFQELKRIFLLMPKWNPGKTNNRNVKASTVIFYEKPITYLYGNALFSDSLIFKADGELDTEHVYANPQIKPQEVVGSKEYFYSMSLDFEYPEELIKDSIITSYTFDLTIDEQGIPYNFKLDRKPSEYSLLDSLAKEHIKRLPRYEPATINGIPVKSSWRFGFFVYPPDYIENDPHRMRKNRYRGRYYQTRGQGLRRHFEANFNYPEHLVGQKILGTVFVSLEALEDGSLKYCYALSGIEPAIDEEVVRVLKMSNDWTYIHSDRPFVQGKAIIVAIEISERHLP